MKFLTIVLLSVLFASKSEQVPENFIGELNNVALDLLTGSSNALAVRTLTVLHSALDNALAKVKCNDNEFTCNLRQKVVTFEATYVVLNSLLGGHPKIDSLNTAANNWFSNVPQARSTYASDVFNARQVAYKELSKRVDDKFNEYRPYKFVNKPGSWRSSDPSLAFPATVSTAYVPPLYIVDYAAALAKYGLNGPPSVNSSQFAADLNETRRLGSAAAVNANANHKAVADLWNNDNQSGIAIVNKLAQSALDKKIKWNDNRKYARALRIVNSAMHDGLFFAYFVKIKFNAPRPRWFINKGVPGVLDAVPNWVPYVTSDSLPEYTDSYQAFYSGVAALRQIVGSDATAVSYESIALNKNYSFTSLTQVDNTIGWTDIYAGTNFRFSTFGPKIAFKRIGNDVFKAASKALPKV